MEYMKLYAAYLEQIRDAVASLPPIHTAVHEYVVRHVPTFLFMDE